MERTEEEKVIPFSDVEVKGGIARAREKYPRVDLVIGTLREAANLVLKEMHEHPETPVTQIFNHALASFRKWPEYKQAYSRAIACMLATRSVKTTHAGKKKKAQAA